MARVVDALRRLGWLLPGWHRPSAWLTSAMVAGGCGAALLASAGLAKNGRCFSEKRRPSVCPP